jgi:predicted permease
MESLTRDLRYGFRSLTRSPGFTLIAVVTIALGIGVNSTIFSLVNAVLFRPLPVDQSEQLVNVYGHTATSDSHDTSSYPNFRDYQEQTETLSGMIAHTNFFANLSIGGSSELVIGELVSRDYFGVLGVQPAIGRAFTPDEFVAVGASPVAILSHPFWQTRFAADPEVAGKTLRLNGTTYTVVGVAPEGFGGMFPAVMAQMWIPVTQVEQVEPLGNQRGSGAGPGDNRLERRGQHFLWVKGRMKPGVSVPQVRTELQAIAARLEAEYPQTNEFERVAVLATNDVALNPDFDSTVAPAGLVLLGAVGLVLLVACANLANMMLSRSSARGRELAVRHTLGAGSGRLMRQLLTESMLLAVTGGIAAMGLAFGLARVIARLQPPLPIDLALDISPDWRVLVFTLLVACVTGVAFGLIPAIRASRPDLVPALKGSSEGDGRRKAVSLRNALVVGQVAVSVVVLVAGALLARSLSQANQVDMGYDVDRTAYLSLAMEMNGYTPQEAGALLEAGRDRLERLPQVEAVGMASRMPLELNNNGFGVYIDGHQESESDRPYIMDGASVDQHYFEALDLELLTGRGILETDRDQMARVAVVTQTMAERFWPGEDPLGREFRTGWEGTPYRIVGVVEDYKVDTPGEAPKPYIHIPLPKETVFAGILVRTSNPAGPSVGAFEQELRALDPNLVFLATGTVRGLADVRLFPIRAGAWLIGVFGLLALVIAAVGLYGVVSYSVSRRLREIGIRKALGAETSKVVSMVLRQGMVVVGIGALIGVGLAAIGAQALSSVLFVSAFDPLSFALACGVLALVGLLANWIPARRASRVDPIIAVKSE